MVRRQTDRSAAAAPSPGPLEDEDNKPWQWKCVSRCQCCLRAFINHSRRYRRYRYLILYPWLAKSALYSNTRVISPEASAMSHGSIRTSSMVIQTHFNGTQNNICDEKSYWEWKWFLILMFSLNACILIRTKNCISNLRLAKKTRI